MIRNNEPEPHPSRRSTSNFDWQRFWVPTTGQVDLSDDGFMVDPTDTRRWSMHLTPTSLQDLTNFPVVVLLGEPGMGKTVALREEANRVTKQTEATGTLSIHFDLRAYSNELLLHKRVFESPAFLGWLDSDAHLILHLDSLDEALLRIDSIANLLAAELPRYPTARMAIRIACRTAVWPGSALEPALRSIWGKSALKVVELAPLRRRDIIAAAEAKGINPDDFITELHAAGAIPFAIKPLTLILLLNQFQKNGRLPRSLSELYTLGCQLLCDEQSDSRRGAQRCQFASNCDPLFASNRDPSGARDLGLSM